MTNIVITTAAITLTIALPTGAMVSVMENGNETITTASETKTTVEGKPIDQIKVVIQMNPQASLSPAPSPTLSPTPTPTATGFSNVPQPQNMLTSASVPQPQNMIGSPSPSSTPTPTSNSNDQTTKEIAELRAEVKSLRQIIEQQQKQNTTTTVTQVNPTTKLPTSQTVTTVQRNPT